MDNGKARAASRPILPGRHWAAILRLDRAKILIAIGERVGRDNISVMAAGVAFYVFVAIPSSLAAIVSVYGLIFNPGAVERQVGTFSGLFPSDVVSILSGFLEMLATKRPSVLGLRLLVGLFVALWSAQSAASAMISALNVVYEKQETRGFIGFQISALILALSSIVFALLALLLVAFIPLVLAWFAPANGADEIIRILRWPVFGALVAVAIDGIYRFAPAQDSAERPWGIWGVVLTTTVWIGSSALFALYVTNIASYDASYGSLGAVVVLLLWIYIAIFVVLLGAELNAEIEKRTSPVAATAGIPETF